MSKFLRKQYMGLLLTVITFVLVVGGFVALFLLMKQRLLRVQEVKQTLATYEQNKKTFAKETMTVQQLIARMEDLEEKGITEEEMPTLLSQIQAFGTQVGVVVEITKVETPTIDGKKQLFVDISAQGEYSKLTAFTKKLLSQEYHIRFSKLAIHQEQGDTVGVWQLLGTFEVLSF